VAFLHEGMLPSEREAVEALFLSGAVQVVVCTASMAWGVTLPCKVVVIMGTQYYDGSNTGGADYPVTDLLQMMGCATADGVAVDEASASGVCVLMCHAPRKEYYKKFLFEPFPVESHLDHFLTDHLSAEVRAVVTERAVGMQVHRELWACRCTESCGHAGAQRAVGMQVHRELWARAPRGGRFEGCGVGSERGEQERFSAENQGRLQPSWGDVGCVSPA
jgi:hypothetical protein